MASRLRFDWERALRADTTVTGSRLLVLLTLGTYMGNDGTRAHPGQRQLAEQTGLSERTVRGHLASAVADGWIVERYRGHRTGDGRGLASVFDAAVPVISTGTPVPVEDEISTGNGATSTGKPRVSTGSPIVSTGTGLPPTVPQQSSSQHSSSNTPASEATCGDCEDGLRWLDSTTYELCDCRPPSSQRR